MSIDDTEKKSEDEEKTNGEVVGDPPSDFESNKLATSVIIAATEEEKTELLLNISKGSQQISEEWEQMEVRDVHMIRNTNLESLFEANKKRHRICEEVLEYLVVPDNETAARIAEEGISNSDENMEELGNPVQGVVLYKSPDTAYCGRYLYKNVSIHIMVFRVVVHGSSKKVPLGSCKMPPSKKHTSHVLDTKDVSINTVHRYLYKHYKAAIYHYENSPGTDHLMKRPSLILPHAVITYKLSSEPFRPPSQGKISKIDMLFINFEATEHCEHTFQFKEEIKATVCLPSFLREVPYVLFKSRSNPVAYFMDDLSKLPIINILRSPEFFGEILNRDSVLLRDNSLVTYYPLKFAEEDRSLISLLQTSNTMLIWNHHPFTVFYLPSGNVSAELGLPYIGNYLHMIVQRHQSTDISQSMFAFSCQPLDYSAYWNRVAEYDAVKPVELDDALVNESSEEEEKRSVKWKDEEYPDDPGALVEIRYYQRDSVLPDLNRHQSQQKPGEGSESAQDTNEIFRNVFRSINSGSAKYISSPSASRSSQSVNSTSTVVDDVELKDTKQTSPDATVLISALSPNGVDDSSSANRHESSPRPSRIANSLQRQSRNKDVVAPALSLNTKSDAQELYDPRDNSHISNLNNRDNAPKISNSLSIRTLTTDVAPAVVQPGVPLAGFLQTPSNLATSSSGNSTNSPDTVSTWFSLQPSTLHGNQQKLSNPGLCMKPVLSDWAKVNKTAPRSEPSMFQDMSSKSEEMRQSDEKDKIDTMLQGYSSKVPISSSKELDRSYKGNNTLFEVTSSEVHSNGAQITPRAGLGTPICHEPQVPPSNASQSIPDSPQEKCKPHHNLTNSQRNQSLSIDFGLIQNLAAFGRNYSDYIKSKRKTSRIEIRIPSQLNNSKTADRHETSSQLPQSSPSHQSLHKDMLTTTSTMNTGKETLEHSNLAGVPTTSEKVEPSIVFSSGLHPPAAVFVPSNWTTRTLSSGSLPDSSNSSSTFDSPPTLNLKTELAIVKAHGNYLPIPSPGLCINPVLSDWAMENRNAPCLEHSHIRDMSNIFENTKGKNRSLLQFCPSTVLSTVSKPLDYIHDKEIATFGTQTATSNEKSRNRFELKQPARLETHFVHEPQLPTSTSEQLPPDSQQPIQQQDIPHHDSTNSRQSLDHPFPNLRALLREKPDFFTSQRRSSEMETQNQETHPRRDENCVHSSPLAFDITDEQIVATTPIEDNLEDMEIDDYSDDEDRPLTIDESTPPATPR